MFVVWMYLINWAEYKQACPVGLMSAGSKCESSGATKGKSLLLQKYLNQRFTRAYFTAGACWRVEKLQ